MFHFKKFISLFAISFVFLSLIYTQDTDIVQNIKMKPLSSKQINNLLKGRQANFTQPFQGTYQLFYHSGITIHVNNRLTYGEWKVLKNQFCSIWTDSIDWTCYDMFGGVLKNGLWQVTWVDKDNKKYSAIITNRKKKE